jgi:hypothetical protein
MQLSRFRDIGVGSVTRTEYLPLMSLVVTLLMISALLFAPIHTRSKSSFVLTETMEKNSNGISHQWGLGVTTFRISNQVSTGLEVSRRWPRINV